MRLHELDPEIARLEAAFYEAGGEVDEVTWGQYSMLLDHRADKLAACYALIRQAELDAAQAKAEEDRFKAMRQRSEKLAERVKGLVYESLARTGEKAVKTPIGTFRRQANSAAPVHLLAPPEAIPDEFCVIERRVDTRLVGQMLRDGAELDFASLGERGEHLRLA